MGLIVANYSVLDMVIIWVLIVW